MVSRVRESVGTEARLSMTLTVSGMNSTTDFYRNDSPSPILLSFTSYALLPLSSVDLGRPNKIFEHDLVASALSFDDGRSPREHVGDSAGQIQCAS